MLRIGLRRARTRQLWAVSELVCALPQSERTYVPPISTLRLTLEGERRSDVWRRSVHGGLVDSASPQTEATVTSEAQLLFHDVWESVESKYGPDLVIPREIVWLNGAPGSGKGANTPFILKSRGLGRALVLSEILAMWPDAHPYMESGELIPEKIVLEALLSEIFDPVQDDGIGMIIDGYPRTPIQVDTLKLLYDKLMQLYNEKKDVSPSVVLPKPSFKVVVLYVDEGTSLDRQRKRGILQTQKSQRAQDAGADDLNVQGDIRSTDMCEIRSKKRYAIFKAHYSTLLRLKSFFPFHLIDAVGSLDDTRRQISRELRYQSSTDLESVTYDAIRHLPMAKELSRLSRQQLTARLDTYALSHSVLFKKIIEIIDQQVLPILKRSAMAGEAFFMTRNRLFSEKALAIDVLSDVLSDRGYHVTYVPQIVQIPTKVDLGTGEIEHRHYVTHGFKIKFKVSSVRDLGDADLPFSTGGGPAAPNGGSESEIAASYMPKGTDHQAKYTGRSAREALVAQCLARDLDYRQEGLAEDPPQDSQKEELDPGDAFEIGPEVGHEARHKNEGS